RDPHVAQEPGVDQHVPEVLEGEAAGQQARAAGERAGVHRGGEHPVEGEQAQRQQHHHADRLAGRGGGCPTVHSSSSFISVRMKITEITSSRPVSSTAIVEPMPYSPWAKDWV